MKKNTKTENIANEINNNFIKRVLWSNKELKLSIVPISTFETLQSTTDNFLLRIEPRENFLLNSV